MYTAEEFQKDLIANMMGNSDFPPIVSAILKNSYFQFADTGLFTRVVWNTYERDLTIFCAPENKKDLEKYKEPLLSLCSKVHGTRDECLLMNLDIIAKSGIAPVTAGNTMEDDKIVITTNVVIERNEENYVGEGGFAVVYKYYDDEKDLFMAIKVYAPSTFQKSRIEFTKKRFLREGKKLLGYSHPNIVKVYDYGFLGDDSAYIKMEYIRGQKLYDFVESHQTLDAALIDKLCYQYIAAMAYVHKTDLHRDISYSNVMITNTNDIKVLDFGFARNDDDTKYDTEYYDIVHNFAPPNERYTNQTEVYCIGAILYTIITGKLFDKPDLALIDKADCNTKLKNVTKRCLAINPDERFYNAIEIVNFLREANTSNVRTAFTLDQFRKELKLDLKLHFNPNCFPTDIIIEKWIDTEYREYVKSCGFQSTVNLISMMKTLPGLNGVSYSKSRNYDLKKGYFVDLLDFYDSLEESRRVIFFKNMHVIIAEVAVVDEPLPFN